jgi:hypothetical protein
LNGRSQKLESVHRSGQTPQVVIESNPLVPRKEFWGVFGPFLTVLGLIIFAFLISFYNQSRRYYNYQNIKWESAIGNINHVLYKHNNKGSTYICEFTFEVSKITIPGSEYCNEILTKYPKKIEFLNIEQFLYQNGFSSLKKPIQITVFYNPSNPQQFEITREDFPNPTKPNFPWDQLNIPLLIISACAVFYFLSTREWPETPEPPKSFR